MSSFDKSWLIPTNIKAAFHKYLILEPLYTKARWIFEHLSKAIIGVLWNERNRRIFQATVKNVHTIITDLEELLYDWSTGNCVIQTSWSPSLRLYCWLGWSRGMRRLTVVVSSTYWLLGDLFGYCKCYPCEGPFFPKIGLSCCYLAPLVACYWGIIFNFIRYGIYKFLLIEKVAAAFFWFIWTANITLARSFMLCACAYFLTECGTLKLMKVGYSFAPSGKPYPDNWILTDVIYESEGALLSRQVSTIFLNSYLPFY